MTEPPGAYPHPVTLRELFDARLSAVEQALRQDIAAQKALNTEHAAAHAREHAMSQVAIDKAEEALQRAVDRAEADLDARFKSFNEFRGALSDQSKTFVSRDYVDQMKETLEKRADDRYRSLDEAGVARAATVRQALERAESALSRRLDESDTDRRKLAAVDALQENKWSGLEGRMYAISGVLTFVLFLVAIISFVLSFFR